MRFRFRRRRGQAPDNGLAKAAAELEISQERLEIIREHVIRPIMSKGTRNQFSDHIRSTLGGGGQRA